MEIPLTRGKVSHIDNEDRPLVAGYSWCVNAWEGRSYAVGRHPTSGKITRMHRVILGLSDPKILVDHCDGDTLNNRRHNLRPCSPQQNLANSRRSALNTSGFKGVSRASGVGRFRAVIRHQYRLHHLGYFGTAEDAARAYDRAAVMLKGQFARVNFPQGA